MHARLLCEPDLSNIQNVSHKTSFQVSSLCNVSYRCDPDLVGVAWLPREKKESDLEIERHYRSRKNSNCLARFHQRQDFQVLQGPDQLQTKVSSSLSLRL